MTRSHPSRVVTALALVLSILAAPRALAAGAPPSSATHVQRELAQQRFNRGRDHFTKKEYAKALAEFQGSYDIVASPNARLYVAHCYRELGKIVLAYVEFGRVAIEANDLVAEDPRYAKTAESANAERAELAPKIAFVTVSVAHATDETRMTIAGDEIARAGWTEPIPVMPGTIEIVVTSAGRRPVRATLSLGAGEKKEIAIDSASPEPPPAPTPPSAILTPPAPRAIDAPVAPAAERSALRPWGFVAAGIGAAGLATFAIGGVMSGRTYRELENECQAPCPSKSGLVSTGKREQTIANVGLVVGAVGAVAAVTIFVVTIPKGPASREEKIAISAGPAWIGLRGAF
jgi:hypothetical protein